MIPSELRLVSTRDAFVRLPTKFTDRNTGLTAGSIVSVRSVLTDKELLLVWNGHNTSGDFAELDFNFAQLNGFKDELIVLSCLQDLKTSECTSCRVELIRPQDLSMLNSHTDVNLLESCQLITKDLVIPIWLSQNVQVPVKVISYQPGEVACFLSKWTEMFYCHSSEVESNDEDVQINTEVEITELVPYVTKIFEASNPAATSVGTMLIVGDHGSGKTSYLKAMLENYKAYNCDLFNCRQLFGKRPEAIKKIFDECLSKAAQNQHSIIALDDIDAIALKSPEHENEKGHDIIYRQRLVDLVLYLIKSLERQLETSNSSTLLVASCQSLDILDNRISRPKGRRYFTHIHRLSIPNLCDRTSIARKIMAQYEKQMNFDITDADLTKVLSVCESYLPSDLRRLVERAIISACSRALSDFDSEGLEVIQEDFVKAADGHVPVSLRNVCLKTRSSCTFNDVGGMRHVKEILTKTILRPLKYPRLFSRCPLRGPTSILLYGPPGCGKTYIAEALTNFEGLNSISVRGPELLSKYIGASEAAVVNLFQRAKQAKPCVIILDEFDALVPKRGTDSTGVTDRVVNQFLTLMDGVERLDGTIFIVAATSRPDMMDPAILRPGRLDKHVYCGLPSEEDRLGVLKILTRKIQIDSKCGDEEFLKDWARRLDNFTHSDIRAFLYSAQLKALRQFMDARSMGCETLPSTGSMTNDNGKNFKIIVDAGHFKETFDEIEAEVKARNRNLAERYPSDLSRANFKVATRATLM